MGTTALNAAKTYAVSLRDASAIFKMGDDVVPLGPARLARAHGLVVPDMGAVFGAEVAPAVLTYLDRGTLAPREPPAELAGCRSHMEAPGKCAKDLKGS